MMQKKSNINFRIEKPKTDTLKILFSGRLNVDSVAELWFPCINAAAQYRPHLLILDFKDIDYCDGAGIALIQTLKKLQTTNNHGCEINNLKPDFESLLEHIEQQPNKVEPKSTYSETLSEYVGHVTVDFLKIFYENIVFLGVLSYQLFFPEFISC